MCPFDPDKIEPGVCGCGVEDTDSDGDGTPDCNEQCDADTDGNGLVNVSDLLNVIASWGLCDEGDPCPADTDGNGIVNVSDLLTVIAGWGECPGAWFGCSGTEDVNEADFGLHVLRGR